jgi:large subunit ribosomal protein L21
VAYAVIETGGKQLRVTPGEIVRVPLIAAVVGSSIKFDVLLRGDGPEVEVGSGALDGVSVTARVLEHGRGAKIIVFKKKRRKGYKKTSGHRQDFTAVQIESIG